MVDGLLYNKYIQKVETTMNILKNIYYYIKSIFRLFLWILKQYKHADFKNYIEYKISETNINILGNGPSLNNIIQDSSFLQNRNNQHYCVVNDSALSPFFKKLQPEHYLLADPLYFERPSRIPQVESLIKEILLVSWNMKLYIPFRHYKLIKNEMASNNKIKVIPFHTNMLNDNTRSQNTKFWLYKKGLSCPRIQNVIIGCIYCMINSGYKNIKLYGVEHSWTNSLAVNNQNQVCLKDVHYYDTTEVKMEPWLKCSGEPYRMYEILRDLAYMFEGYFELKEYAKYIGGIRIINKTPNSFIDAFEKE